MAIRVVQWTTGNVGKESLKAILANPTLDLVGCFAWSKTKVGVNVGELAGIGPVGLAATDDVEALLSLRADCVVYNPMWPSVDELIRILGAGVNVVTTAAFITGANLGAERDRLVVGGRTIIDLNVRWKKGATLDPPWVIEKDGWIITVEGLPTVTASLDFLPPPDFEAETIEEFMTIGHIITALPAINAIAPVVNSPPGIVTYADLDMPSPRGWARNGSA